MNSAHVYTDSRFYSNNTSLGIKALGRREKNSLVLVKGKMNVSLG